MRLLHRKWLLSLKEIKRVQIRNFPGITVAKTLSSQCKAPGFHLWSGNLIPHATNKIWCSQINKILSIDLKKQRERACTNTGVTMFGDWKILYYKDVKFPSYILKKKKIVLSLILSIPQTAVCQGPLSMGFSRREYWSGLPCPPPGNLPNAGIELGSLMSSTLAGRFFTTSTAWGAFALS